MEKGENKTIKLLLKYIDKTVLNEIINFEQAALNDKFIEFNNMNLVDNFFEESNSEFLNNSSSDEIMYIRNYTGYNFRNINAILRNNWTYEINGILDDKNRNKYIMLSESISQVLKKYNNISYSFKTFRGVTIEAFKKYGIETLEDLKYMEGKYMYDEGFTSTSILRDTSYFNKNILNSNYNIEIEYLISKDTNDGILLNNNDLTYSSNQNEYLLDKGSLSKVLDVRVDEILNIAHLKVLLYPKKIWNKENDYEKPKHI